MTVTDCLLPSDALDCGAVDLWLNRPLLMGSPDSPVIFSRGALHFSESGQFAGHASLGTGHCPGHTGQSGAPQAGANLFCSILIELPKRPFSLYVYMNFMDLRKYQLGKLVSP
jgi:hypothetical protein